MVIGLVFDTIGLRGSSAWLLFQAIVPNMIITTQSTANQANWRSPFLSKLGVYLELLPARDFQAKRKDMTSACTTAIIISYTTLIIKTFFSPAINPLGFNTTTI